MDSRAVLKAETRLRICQETLPKLESCEAYEDFELLWYTFLCAAKSVYTVLEQGAKNSAQSRQWFGNLNRKRREDPFLLYMSEARNSDEHGIEPVTQFVDKAFLGGVSRLGSSRDMTLNMVNGIVEITSNDGRPVYSEIKQAYIKLSRIHTRSGILHPPDRHLGQDISGIFPYDAAFLMVEHLTSVLEQAKSLPL